MSAAAETLEFKAELKQLLHLITHSLYSDREIFLRELISNASDAINKAKFDSLDNDAALEDNKDWAIRIVPDKAAKTLTVSDNGVGMGREAVVENLGTVAKSGTKAFVEALKSRGADGAPGLIGQFGVGFYSSFMVADTVTVRTRPAGGPQLGVEWTSDGQGTYTLAEVEKAKRGTDVVLHLKDDALEYLDEWRLRAAVKKFSDFIEHPVELVTTVEQENEPAETKVDVVNSRRAIWLRSPREVTPEEYAEFAKTLTHDSEPPAKTLHFAVEGKTEFRALLFVPARKPYSFDYEQPVAGLKLYAQRVLIMERCEELLPAYLRFVKGVVDSPDLPLNVSREILQQNAHLDTIRKNVVRNVLSGLEGLKNVEFDKYKTFYHGLGSVLKEGLQSDWENKEKIADLMLFETANGEAGALSTLAEYVEKMPEGQDTIYTLSGESAAQLRHSPYLESFKSRGYDVLLLTDPIDEFVMPNLREYKGKKFQPADRGEVPSAAPEVSADVKAEFVALLDAVKTLVPEVGGVRLTNRLSESAAVLVAEGGVGAYMERILKRGGQDAGAGPRVLELNPGNAAVQSLKRMHAADAADPRLADATRLLYEQAVVAEGSRVADPAGFARRVNALIAGMA